MATQGLKPRRLRVLASALTLALLSGALIAAQQERLLEEEVDREAQQALPGEQTLPEEPAPPETADAPEPPPSHANHEAPVELITLAGREPEQFIGKTLVLRDALNTVTVGPVLELRQGKADQEAYLIVDATSYFNSPTRFAVAVKDVAKLEEDRIVMPESAGMHLRGLEYNPEDYTELADTTPVAAPFSAAD